MSAVAGGSLLVLTLPVNVMASAYTVMAEVMKNRATAKDAKMVLDMRIGSSPGKERALRRTTAPDVDGNLVA